MIVACEKFQDKVYIVDGNGRFWRFEINWAGEPQVIALTKLFRPDELNAMVRPQLAHWDTSL
jgi:hypothetical protein